MFLLSTIFSILIPFSAFASPISLPSLKIDPSAVTISGISSGAFMAVQMQVAYSKTFSGVGSFAGGIYWCAESSDEKAYGQCMIAPEEINVEKYVLQAKNQEKDGNIDPLSNLNRTRAYIFAGAKDVVIHPEGSGKLKEFLSNFINANQIQFKNDLPASHGFPTLDFGNPCSEAATPWIIRCNFDGAGELLKQLYGKLNPPVPADDSHLYTFDQREFIEGLTPLYPEGYVYIPKACTDGANCKLHISLHGCKQNADFVGDAYQKNIGLNRWAETNNIVVLYPESTKISTNPYACWDWYGFTGPNYINKNGSQMRALKKMVDRLMGKSLEHDLVAHK